MSNLETKIVELNNKAKQLNTVRQQNLGKRDALIQQQADAINAYNQKYGTNITAETVETEYQRIAIEKQQEVEKVQSILTAIENGNIDLANQLANVVTEKPVAQANDAYVDAVTQQTATLGGTVTQAVMPKEIPQSAPIVNEVPIQAAPVVNQVPVQSEAPVQNAVPPTPQGNVPFIPSPVKNPVDVKTGEVSNIPKGSVFSKDFSVGAEEDSIPAPPPSLASLL